MVATRARRSAADWPCRGRTVGQVSLGSDADRYRVGALVDDLDDPDR
jgi:hypothetical protein